MIEAWIDVGGTFTDCYVVDNERTGVRGRLKVLSSALVPLSRSSTDGSSDPRSLVAPELSGAVDEFWTGAQLRCLDGERNVTAVIPVLGFDGTANRLSLAAPIPSNSVGWELDSHLEAPVLAVRRLLNCPLGESLPGMRIRLGTTRGTNALLTRRGAKVALAITAGFEDLLLIGDQTRPRLFELAVRSHDPLSALVVPVEERLDADGHSIHHLNTHRTLDALRAARRDGCDALAVCLLHSYRNPEHEVRVEQLGREAGFTHVSRSSQLAPLIEIVARARTTVVDAYLGPIVRSYLQRLAVQFGSDSRLQVMTSAGGLVDWFDMAGKDSILSGPAGGVVALRALSAASGRPHLIGLDMGGTSTDTCRTAPDQGLQYESTKAGVRILTATLPIETVASGGGSICWFDGVSLRVGPQSAGALPGPACYGRGGPLTITDLNVFVGRLPAHQFPFPLDRGAIHARLAEIQEQLSAAGLMFSSLEALADGYRRIAAQQMAEAVRTVSISEGADPRQHALVGFGGAAGQHICEIADLLKMQQIIHTHDAGLLSALGMGLASERRDAALPIYQPLQDIDLVQIASEAQQATDKLMRPWQQRAGADGSVGAQSGAELELRYQGTDVALAIPWQPPGSHEQLSDAFHSVHRKRFGYARPGHGIEVVAVRLHAVLPPATSLETITWSTATDTPEHAGVATDMLWVDDHWQPAAQYAYQRLAFGQRIVGPAIVLSPGSTLVIEAKWHANVGSDGTLLIERGQDTLALVHAHEQVAGHICQPPAEHAVATAQDPVLEAVFAQRLAGIATQMGLVLQQTALSVNVKQRRDFSCAIFDGQGRMLASAPHVPVHLGAMGATVRAALAGYPQLLPGDAVITNDPYAGGSHLPDVTVIHPVFSIGNDVPAMFVANRAHHADIGGVAPGSMSVLAIRLGDEGVIIPLVRLSGEQLTDLEPVRQLLASSPWPPRKIDENLADLRAQVAANARGIQLLEELASAFTWPQVRQLSAAVLDVAHRRVSQFIATLSRQARHFCDALDDGTPICVRMWPEADGRLVIDFAGSGPVSRTNFNANPSIVTAAVIYVLRTLIADDLPLNEGMIAGIDLRIPAGILNPPAQKSAADRPAVAAGNVETSQRVVDVLLGALGVAAASQGTMNNLLFGNDRFGFYETIGGGAGATSGCAGASGVHTHMTNTRLTDPEILESKYPARLIRFGLRRGSGGAGQFRGGDGIVRTIQFLLPVKVSLLTSRRGLHAPYGAHGGQDGAPGLNTRIDLSGHRSELPASCYLELLAGEAIEIQTPGGGGWGEP